MYFLYNLLTFFKKMYYTLLKKNNDTEIKFFLENLSNNWNSINPNNPIYYDILNLYIKYSKEYSLGKSISEKNINEYKMVLDNLYSDKNKNEKIDINEHMKYYITGWYIHNIPTEKENQVEDIT